MIVDLEVLDRDGNVIAMVRDGAAITTSSVDAIVAPPPRPWVEDLFSFRDALEAELDAGLRELLGEGRT